MEMKNCPFCGEEIHGEAINCQYCQKFLGGDTEEDIHKIKEQANQSVNAVHKDREISEGEPREAFVAAENQYKTVTVKDRIVGALIGILSSLVAILFVTCIMPVMLGMLHDDLGDIWEALFFITSFFMVSGWPILLITLIVGALVTFVLSTFGKPTKGSSAIAGIVVGIVVGIVGGLIFMMVSN